MRDFFQKLIQPLQEWWSTHSEPTRELPLVFLTAFKNFSRYSSRQSAALAFYALFSVFPLTLLLAVLIGGLLEPAVAQEQIANGCSNQIAAGQVMGPYPVDVENSTPKGQQNEQNNEGRPGSGSSA